MSGTSEFHTDSLILSLIQQRREKGMNMLFDNYFDDLLKYVLKLTEDKEESEDILQTVFIDLWQNADNRQIHDLKSYLYKMSKFQVYRYWSKKEDITELLDLYHEIEAEESVSTKIEAKELNAEIQKAIKILPTACRQIFELSRFDDLSHDEIASKLNLSKQTVKNQLSKALVLLKNRIDVNYLLFLSSLLLSLE